MTWSTCRNKQFSGPELLARDSPDKEGYIEVVFLPVDSDGPGFQPVRWVSMPEKAFHKFHAWTKSNVEDVAKILVQHSKVLGVGLEALEILGQLTTISKGDYEAMATRARIAKDVDETEDAVKAKPAKAGKKAAATKAPAKKTKANGGSKPEGSGRPSVSKRFCELIMEGKLTDDGIFDVVKKEYGLDDSKRGYVAWNRSYLRKMGMNPPEPIGGKASPKSAASKADPAIAARRASRSAPAPKKAPPKKVAKAAKAAKAKRG